MQFSIFSKIGAVLAVLGLIGYVIIFPSVLANNGQDFDNQVTVDANSVDIFRDYDTGDSVTILDTISRMQYDDGKTSIWLESIGKSDQDSRFIFSQNLMNDFGVGSNVVLTFEVSTSGQSEILINEEINTRPSTVYDYIFILLTVAGIGLVIFGFVRGASKKIRPNVVEDDWGAPAPPGLPPQPQNPASMAAIPEAPTAPQAPTGVPQANPMPLAPPPPVTAPPEPTSMTITVPAGVVPGQVLTVTMPTGQSVNVQVPAGCPPGSQFTITVKQ